MRRRNPIIVLGALCCMTADATEPPRPDKGWIAHNMTGSCEMIRGVEASEAKHVLTIQVLSNPQDTSALHEGRTMFSLAVFDNSGMKNTEVESFSLLESENAVADRLTIVPEPTRGLTFVLGGKADAALQHLQAERFVRVRYKDGEMSLFSILPKGYAASKAMFDACVRALAKNA